MLEVFDGLFAHDFLVEVNKECQDISWKYTNVANRKQYPSNSVLSSGTHKLFGNRLYQHKTKYTIKNNAPEILTEVLDFFVESVICDDSLRLVAIDANLQIFGQDGSAHRDVYMGDDKDRTILFYPHYEWKDDWGGGLEILDDTEKVLDTFNPLPGRIIYFDSSILHRAKAPKIPNIGRMSIAFRMSKENIS